MSEPSTAKTNINTGYEVLDSVIHDLLTADIQLVDQNVKKLIDKKPLLIDDVLDKFNFDTLRVVEEISSGNIDSLIKYADDETKNNVEKVKAITSIIADLLSLPEVKDYMAAESQSNDDISEKINNSIYSIFGQSSWSVVNKKFEPKIKLTLCDKDKKILLSSTLDWSDISFLIGSTINIFSKDVLGSLDFNKLNILHRRTVINCKEIVDNIDEQIKILRETQECLKKIGQP